MKKKWKIITDELIKIMDSFILICFKMVRRKKESFIFRSLFFILANNFTNLAKLFVFFFTKIITFDCSQTSMNCTYSLKHNIFFPSQTF